MSSLRSAPVELGTTAVVVAPAGGSTVLKLRGELDIAMVPTVRTRLAGVDGAVELDCAGLTFMDAAGVNLFVEIHDMCTCRGVKLRVVNAPHCVTWLLALTEVDALFDVSSEVRRA